MIDYFRLTDKNLTKEFLIRKETFTDTKKVKIELFDTSFKIMTEEYLKDDDMSKFKKLDGYIFNTKNTGGAEKYKEFTEKLYKKIVKPFYSELKKPYFGFMSAFNVVVSDGTRPEKEKLIFVHLSSSLSTSKAKEREFVDNIDNDSDVVVNGSSVYVGNWIHMFKNIATINKSSWSGLEGITINELEIDTSVLLSDEDTTRAFDELKAGLMKARRV